MFIMSPKYLKAIITVIIFFLPINNGFNVSPNPNIIFREPNLQTAIPKTRSSYFGFSINLKSNSVIVGAPRAQSTLDSQRRVNETGAVYKCMLRNAESQECIPFVFDEWGNMVGDSSQYIYSNEMKQEQWLGATMDGTASDNSKFVVCAPRLMSSVPPNHYLMHGICYWTSNTNGSTPTKVQKIAPLRLKDKQQNHFNGERYFYHMFGEQGISAHVTENNEEIIIGAPGIYTWKGSIVRHRAKPTVDLGGLSRRDENGLSLSRTRDAEPEIVEYGSDVPNPLLWDQDDNSYFGFAVSSGYFDGPEKKKLLYVATAPQANIQQGEAYIFDIVDHSSFNEKTIKKYYTFSGMQFGEYFGYALVTDDFDNDGYTDVAISAPFHSKEGLNENGAVYIYRNEGSSSNFVLNKKLQTDYEFGGRFGTTMVKIGDINRDGFNDIAIGAPYEENGIVYLYYGGSNGLSSKPNQRIVGPKPDNGIPNMPMFGHGISKGADIDGNNYLDLAIGAPNSESVYVYRSYPVIRVNASITPNNQEIKTTDRSIKFTACWLLESPYPIDFDVHYHAIIKIDGQLGRVKFPDQTNLYEVKSTITENEQCIDLSAFVTFSIADIFKPIELEMMYNIINIVPQNGTEFCRKCVAVNPNDLKLAKNKIVFSTGCKSAKCVADLKLKSSLIDVKTPYILGSTSSLLIDYNIENKGETAYLTQIEVTLPETNVAFTKTPSNCIINDDSPNSNVMKCDMKSGSPMFNNDKASIRISIDTTKLTGSELIVKSRVFSTGDELNDIDNSVENVIILSEFSDIEIIGDSSHEALTLENGLRVENLTHTFEIHNNGPSNIKSLDVMISFPISFLNPLTLERQNIIDFSNVSIKGMYDNQPISIEWTQNNVILIANPIETTTTVAPNTVQNNYNGMDFDASRIGLEYDLNNDVPGSDSINSNGDSSRRRRRHLIDDNNNIYYNRYSQRIVRSLETNIDPFTLGVRMKRDLTNIDDNTLKNLPINRTIFFDCNSMDEQQHCIQAKFTVHNFKHGNQPILISLNFSIDLNRIDKIFTDKKDIFVIRTSTNLKKSDDALGNQMSIVQTQPFTVISKFVVSTTPLWVYILSIIVGILALILITYALHRFGFFKRGKREELVKLKRQSEAMSYYPKDDDENEN